MRIKFDAQLRLLGEEMTHMGSMIESAIQDATHAFLNQDVETAKRIMAEDEYIDQEQKKIENICFQLLIQQQPVARDLRTISSALKMISDLERIGDQAADIADLTRHVGLPNGSGMLHIADMARAVIGMVTDSVDSFVKKDLDLARAVYAADDQVDALFEQVKQELIDMLAADATYGEQGLDLLMVAKYLERIGDHATNVAEWVEYSLTGVHPSNN